MLLQRSESEELAYKLADSSLISDEQRAKKLYWNFLLMCVAFSCNHGCVVSCLAYASTELGDDLGGVGSGVLYAFYTFTSLLFARPIVEMIGPKNGLLMGVMGYCIYIAGFLAAILFQGTTFAWPVFITACSFGGMAGGVLWPSQGKYFTENAKQYSTATSKPMEECTATFAGIFATSYLGLELVTKGLATGVFLLFPKGAY